MMHPSNRFHRIVPVLMLAVLMSAPIASAETLEAGVEEGFLKISEKSYDEEAGKLRLRLRNESSHQTVTAFGVATVHAGRDGTGGTLIQSREMLPGDGIAPGAIYEMEFDVGGAHGLQATIHYEILSDTSSHGNAAYIDGVFESRAIYLRELEKTLARTQDARSRVMLKSSISGFWTEEAERHERASQALSNVNKSTTDSELARWEAIVNTTDLSVQAKKRIDEGEPAQEVLEIMEWLLRKHLVEPMSTGVRWSDLEKIQNEEQGEEVAIEPGALKSLPEVDAQHGCATKQGGLVATSESIEKAFIEDCLLHPGSIQNSSGHACPNLDPWITVSTGYRCEECNSYGPWRTLAASGSGQCWLDSGSCAPVLNYIDYQAVWVRISITNKRILALFCVSNGGTDSMASCSCPTCGGSPIIISLDDGAVKLTGPEEGVDFDLIPGGTPERTAWTEEEGDEAFLVLDRNGDGLIGDGTELFGDSTPQPILDPAERNGFAALAVFDDSLSGGNEDGFIDTNDEIFSSLQLWVDSNHNGLSEAGELFSLSEGGVVAIDLDYRTLGRRDRHGNVFRFASNVEMTDRTTIAWDVFFRLLPHWD